MIKIKILSALAMLVLSTPFAMAQTATPVTIAIAVDGFQFTPLYVARANDYFKAEGLAVQLLPSGGGAKAMTSVLSGSANVLAAVASEVINADNHGQNVEIFAALLERPVMSVVVQREIATREGLSLTSPLDKRLAALRGLKIGISSTRSASDAITRVILTRAHLDPARDVEIVPTGGAANQVAAFLAGKVDAFTGTSPSPEEVLARGQGVELFDVGNGDVELYQHYPWTVISAKRDWLQSNPTVVRGLIRAFAKAQQFVRENPEGTRKILRDVFPHIDAAAFEAACKRNFPAVAADPTVHLAAIATSFTEFKILSNDPLNVTVEQIATNAYVAAALGSSSQ